MTEHASPKKLANIRKNVVKFFKDIRMELKKVIWPNRKQLVNNTGTVLMACLVVGAIIWIIDLGLTKIIEITLAR
ncbi:MAG: preprotein translocase subunit SecE [Clostridiales bacterium]|nr:preprotein translocase subunit SecE [Clostridiales bacterium]